MFDLDGTLLNTLADIAGACNEILARHGYPQHPLDAYTQMVGNGFALLVRRALPQDRMPDTCELDLLTEEAKSVYAQRMREKTEPYPGMRQALANIAAKGIQLAVLSNKPDKLTSNLVAHYFPDIPFSMVAGGKPDVPLKPDPAGALLMLKKMGVAAKDSAYVGDSNVDMQTAHNAGMLAVGAAWGFRGCQELRESGAAIIVDVPADLPAALIEKLSQNM